MAFVSSPLPQEEQNQLSGTGQTTPNPMGLLPPQATQTGGSSGQAGATAGSGPTPGIGTSTQFGSGASRLGDYLKANQDQVQQMANNISGNINSQFNSVQKGVDQAASQFGSQVQAGYTPTDPTVLKQVQDNPVQAAGNADTVSSFQKQLNDQYTGPSNFEGTNLYGGAQKQVQDAIQQSNLLGTYPGLSTYLQNNVEQNATPGQNTLDTVLLQGNMPAYQTVKDAAKPFAGLNDYLTNATSQQDKAAQTAAQAAPAAKQAAQDVFGNVTTGFNKSLQDKLNAASTGAKNFNSSYNDLIARLSNTMPTGMDNGIKALTPEQLKGIGVNQSALDQYAQANQYLNNYSQAPGPVNQMLGNMPAASPMQLSSFLSGGTPANLPAGLSDVASPDDFAESSALSTLGGNAYSPILSQGNAAQAGTYKPGGTYQTFNTDNANQLVQQVNARDKALADNFFATNPNIPAGDYQSALSAVSKDPTALQPGSGALYMYNALNRIVNGFNAPDPGYTAPTTPPPPTLGPPGGGGDARHFA